MAPLVVRKEIDGFVADRMLEALWREALWLVNDGVATVAEVDDAIRLGAGLRWSFMGTFLTYRIAGGEDGMRHFMAQFGPALQWPWTKLTDVPELTDELIDAIVAQSDEQAGGPQRARARAAARRLPRLGAAGAARARHRRRRRARAARAGARGRGVSRACMADGDDLSQPLALHSARVAPDWVDYNGHAHESRYLQVFGDASDALFAYLGIDAAYLRARQLLHRRDATSRTCARRCSTTGSRVTTQVLDCDARRLHVFHSLSARGRRSAARDGRAALPARRHGRPARRAGRRRGAGARAADRRGARRAAASRARRALDRHPARLRAVAQTVPALSRAIRRAAVAASLRAAFALPSVRVATTIT